MRRDGFFAVYLFGVLSIQRAVGRVHDRRAYHRRFDAVSLGDMRDQFYTVTFRYDLFYPCLRGVDEFFVVSVQERGEFQEQPFVQECFGLLVEIFVVFDSDRYGGGRADGCSAGIVCGVGVNNKMNGVK